VESEGRQMKQKLSREKNQKIQKSPLSVYMIVFLITVDEKGIRQVALDDHRILFGDLISHPVIRTIFE
jgi:hypothetical protein